MLKAVSEPSTAHGMMERWLWIKKTSFPIPRMPNACGTCFNSTMVLSESQLPFQTPSPQTMLRFLSHLPVSASWPEALMPCVVPHSFLLTGTSCLAQVSLQGRVPPQRNSSLESHNHFSSALASNHSDCPAHLLAQEGNSTLSHSLLRWASLSEKSKIVFSLYCIVLSLNLKHVRDRPELLGKGTHEIPAVWCAHVSLEGRHMQSPTLLLNPESLFQPCQFIIAQESGFWREPGAVLEAAQENSGVGNTCHLVCPRHFNAGHGIQRGGLFIAKWNFLLPLLT